MAKERDHINVKIPLGSRLEKLAGKLGTLAGTAIYLGYNGLNMWIKDKGEGELGRKIVNEKDAELLLQRYPEYLDHHTMSQYGALGAAVSAGVYLDGKIPGRGAFGTAAKMALIPIIQTLATAGYIGAKSYLSDGEFDAPDFEVGQVLENVFNYGKAVAGAISANPHTDPLDLACASAEVAAGTRLGLRAWKKSQE